MTKCSGHCSQRSPSNSEESEVNHPLHYTSHPSGVEAITLARCESFLIGNVFKYLIRRKFKGQELRDLKKAEFYLREEIKRVESELEQAD